MLCAICGFEHNNSVQFAKHVHSSHKLTSQEYYDTHVLNSTTPMCPVCNAKPRKFKSITFGYFPCCCEKCSKSTDDYKQKISNMRKRTCKIAAQNYKNTCLQKYGKSSVFETKYFKHESANTKLKKYNDVHYNNRKQAQSTCETRYGANTYAASKEGKQRAHDYMLLSQNKFGTENFKRSMLTKYGETNASKVNSILCSKLHKFYYNDIGFDSNDEIIVYKYCEEHALDFKYQPYTISYSDSTRQIAQIFSRFRNKWQIVRSQRRSLVKR